MIIEYRLFKTSPFTFLLGSFVGEARTLGDGVGLQRLRDTQPQTLGPGASKTPRSHGSDVVCLLQLFASRKDETNVKFYKMAH